jgi:REP element-mobilizing transposase RayT
MGQQYGTDHGLHDILPEGTIKEDCPMPRRPRLVLPGVPLHVIQRGSNHQACFFADEDYKLYLEWLEKYAEECHCVIHAYVLMTNHVHLLLTPETVEAAGALMKRLGQRYGNKRGQTTVFVLSRSDIRKKAWSVPYFCPWAGSTSL